MIEPKRVLRALAEHWALLEPLCEHFDQGTLSLNELRLQLAVHQMDSTPQDITAVLDAWICGPPLNQPRRALPAASPTNPLRTQHVLIPAARRVSTARRPLPPASPA